MARTPSMIQGETLTYQQDGQPAQLVVGTSDWYSWLETASTFTFRSEYGSFTVHLERAGNKRGGRYWRAYRRRNGKLHCAYLGKSGELTLERLNTVAVLLDGSKAGDELLDEPVQAEGAGVPLIDSSDADGDPRMQTQAFMKQGSGVEDAFPAVSTRLMSFKGLLSVSLLTLRVTAINNHGDTAGFWIDGSGNNFGFVEWNGVFTSYKNPHTGKGTVNQLLGINARGRAVGFYTDGKGINHAYQLDQNNGHFYALNPPGATSAIATGINNTGDIVGFLTAQDGSVVGFLLRGTHYSEFDFPNSTNTMPFGVNQTDQIVGGYVDGAGKMHGFLLTNPSKHAHWQSIDDPNGVGTTTVNGLNDKGNLVGFYVDSAGNTDGFLAS